MVHAAWSHNSLMSLAIYAKMANQDIVNVFHFEALGVEEATFLNDGLAQTSAQNLATHWINNALTEWRAAHEQAYVANRIVAQVLERPGNVDHRLVATETTGSWAGTAGDQADGSGIQGATIGDLASSVVIKWKTTLAGRQFRGRTFIGALGEQHATNGVVEAAFITNRVAPFGTKMNAQYGVLLPPTALWNQVIYSRPYNQGDYGYVRGHGASRTMYFPPDYAGNSTRVTGFAVDPNVRTQRRREVGVGS